MSVAAAAAAAADAAVAAAAVAASVAVGSALVEPRADAAAATAAPTARPTVRPMTRYCSVLGDRNTRIHARLRKKKRKSVYTTCKKPKLNFLTTRNREFVYS